MNEGYFGKYRGTVKDNRDPQKMGRLQVMVPSLLGDELAWAMPCVPYAGAARGLVILPEINDNIWVEFEAGRLAYPIWTGSFWNQGEIPSQATAGNLVIQTDAGGIILDAQAGMRIEVGQSGMVIEMANSGALRIENGLGAKIELAQKSIRINDDGLEIT